MYLEEELALVLAEEFVDELLTGGPLLPKASGRWWKPTLGLRNLAKGGML